MNGLTRLIFKLLRAPFTLAALVGDRWLWPLWFGAQGARAGAGLKLVGRPELRLAEGGEIVLGDRVTLFSRPNSNPLQLHTPCALKLLARGARIHIGAGSALSGTVICAAVSVTLGERVLVGANCKITDTDFHPLSAEARRRDRNAGAASRLVVIEDDVFIGAGAVILKGTTLGAGCVVGAGAVVSGQFPPGAIIAGNPARVIKEVESAEC